MNKGCSSLDEQQIGDLIKIASGYESRTHIRDLLFILLSLTTGDRPSEILSLRFSDLFVKNKLENAFKIKDTFTIKREHTKKQTGSKTRRVHEKLKPILAGYVNNFETMFNREFDLSQPLFPSEKTTVTRNQVCLHHYKKRYSQLNDDEKKMFDATYDTLKEATPSCSISVRRMEQILAEYFKLIKIDPQLNPGKFSLYCLRKTTINRAYDACGGDLIQTSMITGHKNPNTLRHYIQRNVKTVEDIQDNLYSDVMSDLKF